MPAYQPRTKRDVVYWNGSAVNDVSVGVNGRGIHIDAIEGWEGQVERRDTRYPNAGADGERVGNAFNSGRTITLRGEIHGTTWENLQSRKRDLAALFEASATEQVLKVPDPTASFESSFQQYVRDLSPVAWWRLGESSGTIAYDVRGSNPGTYTNSPTLGRTGALAGDGDYAVEFDGSNDEVVIPYAAALNPTAVTIAAWVKIDTTSGTLIVYDSRNTAATTGFCLSVSAGKVRFGVAEAGGFSEGISTTTLTTGVWYHIAGTYGGGNRHVYINGVLEAGPTADTYTQNTTTNSRIGRSTNSTNPFDGTIDEVALWNSQLTTAQILAMYQRGSGYYGANDTDGYERITGRVVADSLVFGAMLDTAGQEFAVQIRASDPRIYADTVTTVSDTLVGSDWVASFTNNGKASTPGIIEVTAGVTTYNGIIGHSSGQRASLNLQYAGGDVITLDGAARRVVHNMTYHRVRTDVLDAVAHWRFNETSGVTADNVEGTAAYDGTYTGGVTLNQAGHAASVIAASFDGVNDYVTVPFSAALNPPEFSFECWLNPSATGYMPIANSLNGTTGWALSTTAGYLSLHIYTVAGLFIVESAKVIASSTWAHIVAVVSPSTVSLYVNGELVGTRTLSAAYTPVASTGALRIGYESYASVYLSGKVDNVALFNYALTASDVSYLFDASAASPSVETAIAVDTSADPFMQLPVGPQTVTGYGTGITGVQVQYREARL